MLFEEDKTAKTTRLDTPQLVGVIFEIKKTQKNVSVKVIFVIFAVDWLRK